MADSHRDLKVPPPVSSTSQAQPLGANLPAGGQPPTTPQRSGTTKRVLSAYGQTLIGMAPIVLIAEALIPGQKVGDQFLRGTKKLAGATEELRDILVTNNYDVIVILDKHFHLGLSGDNKKDGGAGDSDRMDARKAAEIIRAAGENAIVAVSTSLERAQGQIHVSSPQLKKIIAKHGKDVIILVDKSLKNPIVITGVSRFAKSKGIPYSEGLLRLASMGLNKILAALPDDVEEEVEGEIRDEVQRRQQQEAKANAGDVEELDASELERTSSMEAKEEARGAGKLGQGGAGKVTGAGVGGQGSSQGQLKADPYDQMKKKEGGCIIC